MEQREIEKIISEYTETLNDLKNKLGIEDKKSRIKELEDRINKAIEYMENTIVFDVPSKMTLNDTYIIDSENYNKLLKILKGEENE